MNQWNPERYYNEAARLLQSCARIHARKGNDESAAIARAGLRRLEQCYQDNALRHELGSHAGRSATLLVAAKKLCKAYDSIARKALEEAESVAIVPATAEIVGSLRQYRDRTGMDNPLGLILAGLLLTWVATWR
jgi:hypothetical protein